MGVAGGLTFWLGSPISRTVRRCTSDHCRPGALIARESRRAAVRLAVSGGTGRLVQSPEREVRLSRDTVPLSQEPEMRIVTLHLRQWRGGIQLKFLCGNAQQQLAGNVQRQV